MTKRVLVIDDDDGVREIIQLSLESVTQWTVCTANSGKDGLAIARSQPLDLILLDVMMPEEDGTAVYKKLQADETTRTIPTILLTAKARPNERKAFMDMGINGIITKPFKSRMLAEDITQIVGW